MVTRWYDYSRKGASFLGAYKSFESLNDRCRYIFRIIQENGPIAKNELANITKIKLTTLNRDLKILIDEKIIVESDIGKSTGEESLVYMMLIIVNFILLELIFQEFILE